MPKHHILLPDTPSESNKFGKMFPTVSPWNTKDFGGDAIKYLTWLTVENEALFFMKERMDSVTPAGYTYFGQLIAHDISYDRSKLGDPLPDDGTENVQSPALDLETLYGGGPKNRPELYDTVDQAYFLLAHAITDGGQKYYDLRRGPNEIADQRNDENLIISQLAVAFMILHNKFVAELKPSIPADQLFNEARKKLCMYYQYIILYDYLPRILGRCILKEEIEKWRSQSSIQLDKIPVEFAMAAFRFGHSQVKFVYQFIPDGRETKIIPDPRPGFKYPVIWNRFLGPGYIATREELEFISKDYENNVYDDEKLKDGVLFIRNNLIRPIFSCAFLKLNHWDNKINVLTRDLLRGYREKLPSGQEIAAKIGAVSMDWGEFGDYLKANFPTKRC